MTIHAVTADLSLLRPAAGPGRLACLAARLGAARRRRATARVLALLDDRLLADIGFAREPAIERFRLVA